MIRLAIVGAPESLGCALAPRLGRIALEPDWQACDAVAYFGPIDESTVVGALHAGKHVLATLGALTSPSFEALAQSAHAANLHLTVVNPDRYFPSRQLIRQHLDAGKLGEPGLVRLHRWSPDLVSQEQRLRDIDLILWYFGKLPERVYAATATSIHLGFTDGGMALLDHAAGARYYSLSLIGSQGAAYFDDQANSQLLIQGDQVRAIPADEGVTCWTTLLQAFADSIAGGDSRGVAYSDSTTTVHAVHLAAQRSFLTKQAVAREGVP